jgi:hypothetical protein
MENGLARLTSRDVYENSNARFVRLSIGSGIIAVICPATDEISPRIWAHDDALHFVVADFLPLSNKAIPAAGSRSVSVASVNRAMVM